MRIGLFFGSFNPIHNGHLAIAATMVEKGGLDKLCFVVSPHNPLKDKGILLDDQLRFEMVKLAISNNSRYEASDVEFHLTKPSFTINTLDYLKTQYPDDEFILIMGSDNYIHLDKWKDYNRLLCEYRFFVYPRPGFDAKGLGFEGNITLIEAPLMDISSTSIRKALVMGEEVDSYLPSSVYTFIKEHRLYQLW